MLTQMLQVLKRSQGTYQHYRLVKRLLKGLGAGAKPEVGEAAAEENVEEIAQLLKGADMVFVTCGYGRRNRNRCSSCSSTCC